MSIAKGVYQYAEILMLMQMRRDLMCKLSPCKRIDITSDDDVGLASAESLFAMWVVSRSATPHGITVSRRSLLR